MQFYMRNMFMLLGPHDSNRRRLVIGLESIRKNRTSEIAVLEKNPSWLHRKVYTFARTI